MSVITKIILGACSLQIPTLPLDLFVALFPVTIIVLFGQRWRRSAEHLCRGTPQLLIVSVGKLKNHNATTCAVVVVQALLMC